MDRDTKNILRFIAKNKFWACLEKDKEKAYEYAKCWLREENAKYGWGWKAIVKASKHSNCVNLTEFKKLCDAFKKD